MKLKKIQIVLWVLCFLCTGIFLGKATASAEEKNIRLGTQILTDVSVEYGDTGVFTLDTESEDSVYAPLKEIIDHASFETVNTEEVYAEDILELEEDGTYRVTGFGTVSIRVIIYDVLGEERHNQIYSIKVTKDMTNVSLETTSFKADKVIYSPEVLEFSTKVNGMEGMGTEIYGLPFKTSLSNKKMDISVSFTDGVLTFTVYNAGTTNVNIRINGVKYVVTIQITEIKLSGSTAFYMTAKQTKQLSVKNLGSYSVTWKSMNPNVVSVTNTGKIQAKKTGNAIILATVNGHNFGCVISVLTATRKKVVKRAKYIGTHWKYSQPLRMRKNYYDCSSLVWKCYKLEGKYFGAKSYAPVAADIAKYCARHKKNVSGNIAKNIQKMKYKPGALTFKTGAKNGRYKGIYHVEMFVGYTFEGVKADGTPIVGTRWGARDDNYEYGSIFAQP